MADAEPHDREAATDVAGSRGKGGRSPGRSGSRSGRGDAKPHDPRKDDTTTSAAQTGASTEDTPGEEAGAVGAEPAPVGPGADEGVEPTPGDPHDPPVTEELPASGRGAGDGGSTVPETAGEPPRPSPGARDELSDPGRAGLEAPRPVAVAGEPTVEEGSAGPTPVGDPALASAPERDRMPEFDRDPVGRDDELGVTASRVPEIGTTAAGSGPEPGLGGDGRDLPPPPPPRGGSGFFPLFLGGIAAAGLGALAMLLLFPATMTPVDPLTDEQAAANAAELAAQGATIAALRDEVGQLSEVVAGSEGGADLTALEQNLQAGVDEIGQGVEGIAGQLAAVQERIAPLEELALALDEQVTALRERVAAIDERVAGVENAPAAPQQENLSDALQQEIETLRSELRAATDEATQFLEDAQSLAEQERSAAQQSARTAVQQSALARIQAAIDSGEPYAIPLAEFAEVTDIQVPDPLAGPAEDGVPTLGALRQSFPEAARPALRAEMTAGTSGQPMERMGAFLRAQTGQRSLAPREGDGPDAILSRAEAALKDGDLAGALSELDALGEPGRAELEGWLQRARTRLGAVEAAATLDQELSPQ